MPIDLAQLTTAFSGMQLVVIAIVAMELRAIKEARKRDIEMNDKRDATLALLTSRISHISGRLNISEED